MWSTFFHHAQSLRAVLLRVVLAWIVAGCLLWPVKEEILAFILSPSQTLPTAWVVTGLTNMFTLYFQMTLLVAFLGILPYGLFEIYWFMRPGLYAKEKRFALLFFALFPVIIAFSIYVSLFYVAPLAAGFFLQFKQPGVEVMPQLLDYFGIAFSLALATLAVLLLPLAGLLMVWWRWFTVEQMTNQRRWVLLFILLISAVLTPPDPFSMLILTIPAYLWFELVMFYARLTTPKKA